LITDPMGVFAICAGVCALIFWSAAQGWGQRIFRIVPSVVLVYYIPTLLSFAGILPTRSVTYDWMRDILLPACLFILMVTTDVRAILRIGPRAIAMMLVGSLGVIIGGPLVLSIFRSSLPPDSWKALAALSGSWIGGSGNFAAIKEAVRAPDALIGPIIVVDTAVGYTWTGILLFLVKYQERFDRWNGVGPQLFADLDRRMRESRDAKTRPMTLADVTGTIAVGFVGAVGAGALARLIDRAVGPFLSVHSPSLAPIFSEFTWMVILITSLGILLSLTPLQRIERGGASKIGYAALYLFLTSIGAKANPAGLAAAPLLLLVGTLWILVHITVLFVGARLLRAPLFLVAVGSQANIGGIATAPVVASAYYEGLAPVGVLMAVLGYLVGNYAGLLCAYLLSLLA
jgi:uncharacterized membrane protein